MFDFKMITREFNSCRRNSIFPGMFFHGKHHKAGTKRFDISLWWVSQPIWGFREFLWWPSEPHVCSKYQLVSPGSELGHALAPSPAAPHYRHSVLEHNRSRDGQPHGGAKRPVESRQRRDQTLGERCGSATLSAGSQSVLLGHAHRGSSHERHKHDGLPDQDDQHGVERVLSEPVDVGARLTCALVLTDRNSRQRLRLYYYQRERFQRC